MANLSWISSNSDYINQMIRNTQVTLSNNYNDLDNIPIIKITSTTNNPQKIWELKEGLYMIDGVVQVDNSTSYEVSNLLISMTARLENGKYILSAFIPYLRGLFEYILKTNSTEYEQHQKIVLMIKNDTLALDNETIYTPIEDYHPATKKYVDDKANEIITELDKMGVNKENLESINKENRIRDIKLQALLSETSDRNITIEENVRYFDMPLSIDNGIVTINEIVGETLVNVCDQEESVAITKSYTVENENHIPLQGEYDGSCRPVLHGNTLVNHNADWDDSLQTGIVTSASGTEDVQVEGIKGQEVSVVVEGNTVLNHALGKTSAVVSSVEDNLWDFNYIVKNDTINYSSGGTVNYSSGRIYFKQTTDYSYTNIFLDRKDIIKPNTYYTLIVDMFKNTLPTDGGIILNSYSADSYGASDVFTIYGTSNDGREGCQNRISGGNIGRFIYKLKSKADFSVSQYALRTFVGNTSQEGELEFSIKLLEGDHTTNPKYVNSNNGNYVDLTVANDMSSVVEIEGRTMVNVCDQKDPIAITKSYTVENSGNHIALQGEYDGSCRPVIQGNTMVNLFDYTKLTNFSSNGKQLEIIKNGIKLTLNEGNYYLGISTMDYTNNMLKPNTTYTFLWNYKHISGNDNHKVSVGYATTTSNYAKEVTTQVNSSLGTLVFTTDLLGTDDYVGISFRFLRTSNTSSEITIGEYTNLMLFEGDLTQTPELIPTEYVEGLKSSFEDGLIPENVVTKLGIIPDISQGNGITISDDNYTFPRENLAVMFHHSNFSKPHTFVVIPNNNNKTQQYTVHSMTNNINVQVYQYVLGFHTFLFNQPANMYRMYTENPVNSTFRILILEGDWTHLTEEDFNHLGKYKVEYKVTGKNKFDKDDIHYVGQIYSDAGLLYNNENYNVGGYIECNKKQYILSGDTNDGSNYNGDYIIEFNEKKEFIKRTYMTKGLINLDDTTKYISVCPYITSKDIQIEEGSTPTEYEPYKEYTKTFYLNSPLLEGDTIENVNSIATHVKRYGKVVLNGNENWNIHRNLDGYKTIHFKSRLIEGMLPPNVEKAWDNNICLSNIFLTDRHYPMYTGEDREFLCISININEGVLISINKNKLQSQDVQGFKQWLSENPTTVIYELQTPIYEPISTESILCDSYVNGHLDFDSAVPVERVVFKYWTKYLTYVKDNTAYTLQFESDNTGYVDWLSIGGTALHNISVTKGINKVLITTPTDNNRIVGIVGIGFNASNIVVTEAIDTDFDYFEGLKSSYECEVTEDGKYKVDVKVTGKNLWRTDVLGSYKMTEDRYYDTLSYKFKDLCSHLIEGRTYRISFNYDITNVHEGKVVGIRLVYPYTNLDTFVYTKSMGEQFVAFYGGGLSNTFTNIQLEEGTEATSYEPYFESTKTFYLNSPLLEGDKIVTKNGKVYHYHKMGKVVLDGSEDEGWVRKQPLTTSSSFATKPNFISKPQYSTIPVACNTLPLSNFSSVYSNDVPGICTNSDACAIYIRNTQLKLDDFILWLSENPTTVVYELASPYYELIDEYSNTILNIPKNVAHLTHTSAVPVNNTTFTNYKDELNVLEANTQYRVMFDCDKPCSSLNVTLGGTTVSCTSTNISGTKSFLITTPSTLVDKNLVIDGIGRCTIDNIRIFKGDVEYDYVKGLWSGYEERRLENLHPNEGVWGMGNNGGIAWTLGKDVYYYMDIKLNTTYTVILENVPSNFRSCQCHLLQNDSYYEYEGLVHKVKTRSDIINKGGLYVYAEKGTYFTLEDLQKIKIIMIEGDWTDNPPTYEEVMANEGKYAVKVKLDTNATIFGKGGRL